MMENQRKEMILEIERLPEKLQKAIAGLSEEQLNTPYRKGGWTVRQVVHHLADSHMNAYIRMKLLFTEDNPTLKPYEQDEWAKLKDSREIPVQSSLSILEGLHYRWVIFLNQIGEKDWERPGLHPENGQVTLESLLQTYAAHCRNHLKQILDLRAAKDW